MTFSALAADDRRSRVYDRLARRNRVVGMLRIAVSAVGLVILAVLLVQIVADNLSEQFGFANLRIDRENLVVETPRLTSTAEDGTLYAATATSAKVSASKIDVVELTGAVLDMTPPGGKISYSALAPSAELQLSDQKILVPGALQISGTDGMSGTLDDVMADILNSQMVGRGRVHIRFGDGSDVEAEAMSYDGTTDIFEFTHATVVFNDLPGKAK